MHNSGTDLSLVRETLEVREGTLHRCSAPLGGAKGEEAKRLEELETENCRPKRLSASAKLDGAMLKQALRGGERGRSIRASASSLEAGGSACASQTQEKTGRWPRREFVRPVEGGASEPGLDRGISSSTGPPWANR